MAGVRLHTPVRPLAPDETRPIAGVVATSPERTLLDCAAGGTAPEQVELAIAQALARTLTTPGRLTEAVAPGPNTLRDLVARALGGARPETYRRNPTLSTPFDVRECWCPGSCRVRDVPILRAISPGAMRVTVRWSPRLDSMGKRSTPACSSCLDALRGGQGHRTRPTR